MQKKSVLIKGVSLCISGKFLYTLALALPVPYCDRVRQTTAIKEKCPDKRGILTLGESFCMYIVPHDSMQLQ